MKKSFLSICLIIIFSVLNPLSNVQASKESEMILEKLDLSPTNPEYLDIVEKFLEPPFSMRDIEQHHILSIANEKSKELRDYLIKGIKHTIVSKRQGNYPYWILKKVSEGLYDEYEVLYGDMKELKKTLGYNRVHKKRNKTLIRVYIPYKPAGSEVGSVIFAMNILKDFSSEGIVGYNNDAVGFENFSMISPLKN